MNIFVFGDTHDCLDDDLFLAAAQARKHNCSTIIHTGDLEDKHFGHPAFNDFQIYVFKTTLNKNLDQNLPPNWHLLTENDCILEIAGIKIYVNHYLGLNVLQTKTPELLESLSKAQVYQINEQIKNKYGYVHYVLFGHSHHTFHHCDSGICMLNPGEWHGKKTFIIISIDESKNMDVHFISLTVNFELVKT